MIYIVINSANQPASTHTNPDALFLSKENANNYIDYLHNELGIFNETFTAIPFREELKDLESPWAFVEKYLRNYSQNELVSESSDLEMIVDGEWASSQCATEGRNNIVEEHKINNGIEPEDFQIIEIAQARLNEVNATIYELAIDGFIEEMKDNT